MPFAFPWIRLGNAAAPFTEFIQSASIFGTLFISLLIVYINLFTSLFIYNHDSAVRYFYISAAISVIFLNNFYGELYIRFNPISVNRKIEVSIAQGNFPKETKFTLSPETVLKKYLALTSDIRTTDLIIFPETALHSAVYRNPDTEIMLNNLCRRYDALLLFGSQYNSEESYYNACMAAFPESPVSVAYLKRILVPFGEFNPLKFSSVHFTETDFSSGHECTVINWEKGVIGCAICFESVFPRTVSDCVKNKAEFIAILSNDSWLGNKIPLYQHHTHSIMRAVENRRYVFTSTNTGISSVINFYGEVISSAPENTENIIYAIASPNSKVTFYTRYGDIIILPACIIILLTFIRSKPLFK